MISAIKSMDQEKQIGGMTRETLHKMLDIALDGVYDERHSIVLALNIMIGGMKAYFVHRKLISKEEIETIIL